MCEARSQDTSSCNTSRLWSNRQTYHSQRHSAHLSLEARLRGAAALAAPILMRALEPSAAAVPAGARRTRRLIWRAAGRHEDAEVPERDAPRGLVVAEQHHALRGARAPCQHLLLTDTAAACCQHMTGAQCHSNPGAQCAAQPRRGLSSAPRSAGSSVCVSGARARLSQTPLSAGLPQAASSFGPAELRGNAVAPGKQSMLRGGVW